MHPASCKKFRGARKNGAGPLAIITAYSQLKGAKRVLYLSLPCALKRYRQIDRDWDEEGPGKLGEVERPNYALHLAVYIGILA